MYYGMSHLDIRPDTPGRSGTDRGQSKQSWRAGRRRSSIWSSCWAAGRGPIWRSACDAGGSSVLALVCHLCNCFSACFWYCLTSRSSSSSFRLLLLLVFLASCFYHFFGKCQISANRAFKKVDIQRTNILFNSSPRGLCPSSRCQYVGAVLASNAANIHRAANVIGKFQNMMNMMPRLCNSYRHSLPDTGIRSSEKSSKDCLRKIFNLH